MRRSSAGAPDLVSLKEAAQLLRLSPYTLQAWISPSSPNHRPDFARLARRAGRKTVFWRDELLVWDGQRRHESGRAAAQRSPRWRELFRNGRGILRGMWSPLDVPVSSALPAMVTGGLLGVDAGPLLAWMIGDPAAARLERLLAKVDGVVLAATTVGTLLRTLACPPAESDAVREFLLVSGVFEIASLDEAAVRRALRFPAGIPLPAALACAAVLEHGASWFATWEPGVNGFPEFPALVP